ncbi:MAG: UDP-N-acetylglucosamine 2-epimerase (non-hydrolyzing) [Alphaproteobacteria bacterium]|nr:UDP-N-acetylglucosamine 2-epimerase (non-hydrolyzing) [Alphaproteobacteria bacterium]
MKPVEVQLIAAARPNFMKVAPLYHALRQESWCQPILVHTGQHYDFNMSDAFFRDLMLPEPDHHLNVGSGTHAQQTGGVMIAYEKICQERRPDWVVVVGDVNSTVACALVGAKLGIPVAHLEAGLRSGDRRMPEEINRLATDAISDVLWTPSEDADRNLLREGVDPARIECVGNIMIDSYEMLRPRIEREELPGKLGLTRQGYVVVTLHRPSNVDDPRQLRELFEALGAIASSRHVVFPMHPRTRHRAREFDLLSLLEGRSDVTLTEPLGYVEFMSLVTGAAAVVTDSGGVQEETTYLGIPCLTLRENTERPVTVTHGTNRLVKPQMLQRAMAELPPRRGDKPPPPLWDGRTAKRVAESLRRRSGRA